MTFIQDIYGDIVNMNDIVAIERKVFNEADGSHCCVFACIADRYGQDSFTLCDGDEQTAIQVARNAIARINEAGIPMVVIANYAFRTDKISSIVNDGSHIRVKCGKVFDITPSEDSIKMLDDIARQIRSIGECSVICF